jgi:hypothetical protein
MKPRKPSDDEDVRVRIHYGNTASVTGLLASSGPGDKPLPKQRFSSLWVKVDGSWKHANYQTTPVSQNPAGQ